MVTKKISDFKTYEVNPSVPEGIESRTYLTKPRETELTLTSTGEVMTLMKGRDVVTKENDTLTYNKVYKSAYADIKEFSVSALKIWCYINENIKPKRDDVSINVKECMEYCNYNTNAAIYKGIIELLDKEFIYRREGTGNFFINVNKFFNGKRVQ